MFRQGPGKVLAVMVMLSNLPGPFNLCCHQFPVHAKNNNKLKRLKVPLLQDEVVQVAVHYDVLN